ncbi:hypothetical protein AB7M16_003078 [Bradyrhizobium sp. USDA 372]
MPETLMKGDITTPLRTEPRGASSLVEVGEVPLLIFGGEKVKTGAQASVVEQVDDHSVTWIFVEAMGPPDVDKRKGFVNARFLVDEGAGVEVVEAFNPFTTQVSREDFASICYQQATALGTNVAYLYALAFVLSGDQWTATDVKTDDPADAPAIGVYRFTKETWATLIATPEAAGIRTDQIKFPAVQCIVAAIVAVKAADLLTATITDRGLNSVDLFLAHLFAGTDGFGAVASARVFQANNTDNTQKANAVLGTIFPNAAAATAFFNLNKSIFNATGSATIKQVLERCAAKMGAGFDEVRRFAHEIEQDLFGDDVPAGRKDPLSGSEEFSGTQTITGIANGMDRRQFLGELKKTDLVRKLADMVKGEVGWGAPTDTKFVQAETAFNRAQARDHSLARALWSKSDNFDHGYYQGGANGTYSRPVTAAEFEDFLKNYLPVLVAGSNRSEALLGFIATGNASPPVSTQQYAKGTRGGDLPTAQPNHPESYFLEGPFKVPAKKLQGGESIALPIGASGPISAHGEPPEQMDGDTVGSGPVGGKFNVPAGTPISPASEHQTITFTNGKKIDTNKLVAGQFLGFFNDLIEREAPVRDLGCFGERPNNRSQHPRGLAIDWAQTDRDVVAHDVRQWIDSHREVLRKLERRWGISGGENWTDKDTGHFSIEIIFGDAHLRAARAASEND